MRKTSWSPKSLSHPSPALTKHPYRDAALAHGTLAAVIVGLGWATSSHVARAALMALGYFVVATGWTWWRLRDRERRDAEVQARKQETP